MMVLNPIPLSTAHKKIKNCGLPAGGSNCSIASESIGNLCSISGDMQMQFVKHPFLTLCSELDLRSFETPPPPPLHCSYNGILLYLRKLSDAPIVFLLNSKYSILGFYVNISRVQHSCQAVLNTISAIAFKEKQNP